MEFWGVEVKAGEPLKVKPDDECLIHVSQAALGESKKDKGNESVHLFLNIDGKKMVLGTLNGQNIPQLPFDLVFEKEFELSHNWKNGSIYFCGYQTPLPDDGPSDFSEDSSEDEEDMIPLGGAGNGEAKLENAKPVTAKANAGKPEAAKAKAKVVEPKKDNKSVNESGEDDSDEGDDESDEDESGEDSEEGMSVDEDSDDEEDESGSEDEETPKKAEPSKKRPNDSATKTPVSSKKQKAATPQKTDGKKPAAHTATPHPAKQGGKGAANGNKSQSPKSGGKFGCTSCSKSFGSEVGLQSHTQAKHGGK